MGKQFRDNLYIHFPRVWQTNITENRIIFEIANRANKCPRQARDKQRSQQYYDSDSGMLDPHDTDETENFIASSETETEDSQSEYESDKEILSPKKRRKKNQDEKRHDIAQRNREPVVLPSTSTSARGNRPFS